MALENVDHCPICNHSSFTLLYTCRDHLSSLENFELRQCTSCSFVVTSPRPDLTSLPSYYQSKHYVSHSGEPTGPINFLYLQARKFTLRWKVNLINQIRNRPTILDYGCGTGELLAACHQKGWTISGLEPSAEARQKAEQITGIKIASNFTELANQQFDVITLWHVLEHIPDLREKIAQLKSMLKQTGVLLVAVPNFESYDARNYKESWAGFDVPRHLWHFSKTTMARLLATESLTIQSILPMRLDAYYVSMLSEKYRQPQQNAAHNLIKGLLQGYRSNNRASQAMNYSSLIYVVTQ